MRDRARAAGEFHARVIANCWDSLGGELLRLHAPQIWNEEPVCRGCDREPLPRRPRDRDRDPTWPCTTYTIIAARMLGIQNRDVANAVGQSLAVAERRVTYT
jgi:hypothetical protein